MAQYNAGTVTVTNGSAIVTGVGTAWLANISPEDYFVLGDENLAYQVSAVDSDVQITLTAPYGGATSSGSAYTIHIGFQANGAPQFDKTDAEFAAVFNRWAATSIPAAFGTSAQADVTTGPTDQTNGRVKRTDDENVLSRDSVADIAGLVGSFDGQNLMLNGWQPNSNAGGQSLFWDSSALKSQHDGIDFFSPTVPWNANGSAYRSATGETDPSGSGCWIAKKRAKLSFEAAGAKGDDSADDYSAIYGACASTNSLQALDSTYRIGTARIGEFQKPLNITGNADTIFRIMSTNVDATAFRVGAVGAAFYRTRATTKFESLTFIADPDYVAELATGVVAAPWALTGIDVQSTYPIEINNITCIGLGPDAVKMRDNFYGRSNGLVLVNSGLNLFEVNTIEFSGFESRSDEATADPTHGDLLFGNVSKYPITLEDSDLVAFSGGVIEGWECPVIRLVRSDDTIFKNIWFESLRSSAEVIKIEQSRGVEFNSCQLDFAFPYTSSFIRVDNSIPDPDRRQVMTTNIRIEGGNLLLWDLGFGQREKLVETIGTSVANVEISGLDFRGGALFASRAVEFDVKSIYLTDTTYKAFYSKANAEMNENRNSWLENSLSTDWDFSSGANLSELGTFDTTITKSVVSGDFITGSAAIKVAGIPSDGVERKFGRTASGMGPVTVNGETYLVFFRVKSSQDLTVRLEIDGGFSDFAETVYFDIQANKWLDVVYQSSESRTWAQGSTNPASVKIYTKNSSGVAADLFIDRIDYKIVNGDVNI